MIEMEVAGIEDVEKGLHELPEHMARGVARNALLRAAEFLRAKVMANIHSLFTSRSGDMLRSIVVKDSTEPGKRGGTIVRAFVASEPHPSKPPYPKWWTTGFQHIGRSKKLAREFRRIASRVKRHGGDVRAEKAGIGKFMEPRDAWTPAFEDHAREALAIIVSELRAGFDSAVAQVRAKFPGKRAA